MSTGFFSLKKICETHSNKKSDCLWEQVQKTILQAKTHQESLGLTLAVASRHRETWLKVWELLFFLKLGFYMFLLFYHGIHHHFSPPFGAIFVPTTKNKQIQGVLKERGKFHQRSLIFSARLRIVFLEPFRESTVSGVPKEALAHLREAQRLGPRVKFDGEVSNEKGPRVV